MIRYYVDPMIKTTPNEYEKIVFNSANEFAGGFVYTLVHHKIGTIHYLKGFPIIEKSDNANLFVGQFRATADFNEGDTFIMIDSTNNTTEVNMTAEPMGIETTLPDEAFVNKDLVSVTIDGVNKKLGFKLGGGGINDTLPSLPIFSLSPKSSSIIINFTELSDIDYPYLMDYVFVYKTNDYPTGYKDGTPIIIPKEQIGKDRNFEISNLISGETYYFRVFTRNFKKQIQTMIIDAFRKIKIGYELPYSLEPLSAPRYNLTSSLLIGGVGVFGGEDGKHRLDTTDFYNSNKVRSTLAPLSQARSDLTSSPLADGAIISGGGIVGGQVSNISDFYDDNKIHSTLTPLKVNRYRLTSSPLAGGVGVFGGTGVSYPVVTVNVDFYDNSKVHTTLTNLSKARGLATSSPLAGGAIVIGGGEGENNNISLDTVDFYDDNKVRTTITPLSEPRRALTSSPLAGGVGVFGGLSSSASNVSDFYDENKIRTTLTPLSQARYTLTSSPLANGVAIFGGLSGDKIVDFYNREKVRTTLQSLSTPMTGATSSPLANGVGVFGYESVDFYPEASTIPQT